VEGGALLTEEFNAFSKNHVMFLHITTHIEGRKDEDLFSKVGGRGFPSFFILDAAGNVVAQHEGPRTAEGFAQTMNKAQEFIDLKKKAEAGDAAAKVDYLLARLRMGQLSPDEAKAAAKSLKMSDEQQKTFRGLVADSMMEKEQTKAVGQAFLKMEKEGYIPNDQRNRLIFYSSIFQYAELMKDIPMMERTFKAFRDAGQGDQRFANYTNMLEKKLEKAKAEAKQ
jgi:hypothetical protein